MTRWLKRLLSQESGQDLVEYTLLIGFVALTTAGLFVSTGSNAGQVWSAANSTLELASGSSSNSQTPTTPPSNPGGGDHHHGDGGDDR